MNHQKCLWGIYKCLLLLCGRFVSLTELDKDGACHCSVLNGAVTDKERQEKGREQKTRPKEVIEKEGGRQR